MSTDKTSIAGKIFGLSEAIDASKVNLIEIAGTFKVVLEQLSDVKKIYDALQALLGGKLPPPEKIKVDDSRFAAAARNDDEYINFMTKLFNKRSDEGRLTAVLGLMNVIADDLAGYRRKEEKMMNSVRLMKAAVEKSDSDDQKEELKRLTEMLKTVRQTVKVLDFRHKDLLRRFFTIRKTELMRILGATEKLAEHFTSPSGGYDKYFKDEYRDAIYREGFAAEYNNLTEKITKIRG